MNTRKRIFLFAFSVVLFATHTLNAQVTIGAETAPKSYSLLELNTTEVQGGLRLPQLTTAQRDALVLDVAAKGLVIFNTETDCLETWNGAAWMLNCGTKSAPLSIILQPTAYTSVDLGASPVKLSILVEGAGPFTYQWYKQTIANQYGDGSMETITGATSLEYEVPVSATERDNAMYFCMVSNGSESKLSDGGRVLVGGCGAYLDASKTQWLKIQCYNLDADESKDPFIPAAAIHGGKYKWGISNGQNGGGMGISQATDQATSGTISNWSSLGTPPATNAPWNMNTQNPCPVGWRVPTSAEWTQIINTSNNTIIRVPDTNTANWTNVATNYATGIMIGDALFLPAAGHCTPSGVVGYRGSNGYCWSSTQNGITGERLYIDMIGQSVSYLDRKYGLSIRCVAE